MALTSLREMAGWGKAMTMRDINNFLESTMMPVSPQEFVQLALMRLAILIKNPFKDKGLRHSTQLQAIKLTLDYFGDRGLEEERKNQKLLGEDWDLPKVELFSLFGSWLGNLSPEELTATRERLIGLMESENTDGNDSAE